MSQPPTSAPDPSAASAAVPPQLVHAIEAASVELVDVRRELHAAPELSWQEHRTTDLVERWMEKLGIDFVRSASGTGGVGELGPHASDLVALRADLDALPVDDTTPDPWRSKVPGIAHACGHDVHVAALLGASVGLRELEVTGQLPRRVRLIFQPAEEVMPGGALTLLAEGAMRGVSRVFALHCDPSLDVGRVGIRVGAITGAADQLRITLTGRGGHTSRPHLTDDLTYALGSLVTQLPAVLSRRLDPRAGVSLVWGSIQAGHAPNVIPATGQLTGTLRILDGAAWHSAEHLVRGLVADIAEPFGVAVDTTYIRGVPPVINNPEVTETLRHAVTAAVGAEAVTAMAQSLGGEDFSWFADAVPGAMGRLGTRTPGGPTYDLHQGDLRVDDRAIAVGAKVLAHAAVLS